MLSNEELFKLAADNGVGMADGVAMIESGRFIVTPLPEEDEDYPTYLAAYRAIAEAARRDALMQAAQACNELGFEGYEGAFRCAEKIREMQ